MSNSEFCFLSATELRALYLRGEVSPVEVTRALLEHIDQHNGDINAYVTVTPELALEQATEAESILVSSSAASSSPLTGIPFSLKDLTATKGIRTTRGSLLYADWVPDFDGPMVGSMREAGAVLLGKTNTPEFGWKGDSGNRVVGPTHNPWKIGRTAGGSSGGASAAVAAGMGPLAQGTDGAGSIRIPACFCGVFGLKPSFGRVPQYPASPVEMLSHAGPITRTVRDAALMLDAVAQPDVVDKLSLPREEEFAAAVDGGIAGLRVAWSPDLGYAPVDPAVASVVKAAVEKFVQLGCEVVEADPGLADPWDFVDPIWACAFAAIYRDNWEEVVDQLEPGLAQVVLHGREFSGADLAGANIRRNEYYHGWRVFMESYDLVLMPTLPVTAFPAGDDQPGQINGVPTTYLGWTAMTYPFNVTGQPAATLPCGFVEGLPVGLQVVGKWRQDATVLRACAAFEALQPWRDTLPPL